MGNPGARRDHPRCYRPAGVNPGDIRLVALHQANIRIINAAVESSGLDPSKVLNNLDRLGNTGAASVPLVLEEAWRQGRLNRGDLVLISGFGAARPGAPRRRLVGKGAEGKRGRGEKGQRGKGAEAKGQRGRGTKGQRGRGAE